MEPRWYRAYPEGVPKEINPDRFRNLVHLFQESVKKFGNREALVNMDVPLTFQELDTLSNAFAAYIQHHTDLQPGDRIAIQLPNLLQYPVVLLGAAKAGLLIVNTNPLYTPNEMEHQFTDAGVKAIVILANFAHKLQQIIARTSIKYVFVTELGDLFPFVKRFLVNAVVKYVKRMVPPYTLPSVIPLRKALEEGAKRNPTIHQAHPDDTLFLQYTGGTTGVAKGAELTHRNLVANTEQIIAWMQPLLPEGNVTVLTPLPLFHIFALTVNLIAFLAYGGKNILITNPRDIDDLVKTMKKYPINVMTGVNTLFVALLNHPRFREIDFSQFKIAVAGGMALQQYTAKKWKEVTGTYLAEGYGLTEASPVVTCQRVDREDPPGSIGIPLPSTKVRLVNDNGEVIEDLNVPGELQVQGPQVMKGYYNRPEETANVFTPDHWLKTGDVAIWLNEEGYLKIVDRKKEVIIVSGFNVYPNEVEDALAEHEGILEVAAIGVPDAHSGEAVKVFVVKKDPNLTEEDVLNFAKERLTGYKRPKYVEFRTELPKSPIGKVLRRVLKEEELKKLENQ